jgi:hypothetical protein
VRPLLRRAATCSPADAAIWIRLGLEAESSGDDSEAERCLLRAAELDHDVTSSWTLANFYFRRGDARHFFPQAQRTLARSQSDIRPVFRMAWQLAPDASRMLAEGMPEAAHPLGEYLDWMLTSGLLDPAEPVAERLLRRFPRQGTTVLLRYCDALIAAGRIAQAAALWNTMDARGLVSGPVHEGRILNGAFRSAPLNTGFDWRLSPEGGVEVKHANPGLWIQFRGDQPESCELASQPLLLGPDTRRVRYILQRSGITAGLGLHWAIFDARNAMVATQTEDFSEGDGKSTAWTFGPLESGANSGSNRLRLVLLYQRPPASSRPYGWVRIDSVSLEGSS